MRLLHVIHSVNPAGGGPIEGVKRFAAAHSDLGNRVDVASLDAPDAPWTRDFPVTLHALGPGTGKYGYTRRLVPWLRAHRRDYDAVIVNGLWQYSGFGVWRALRGTDTPYFVFPHGMLDPWFKRAHPLKHFKKWLYWPWAEYRVLRDARAALFTCEEERRLARESFALYRVNERVVNYGTAAPPGDGVAQRTAFLERFPTLRGCRVVLFLGRIHEKKGADLLLRAFSAVAGHDEKLRLVMAGPDADGLTARLQTLAIQLGISERVEWPGMLTGDLKWGALRCAEVFALTSHQENFGIAVVEALACGTPVLISRRVNIWREIEAARAGFAEADNLMGAEALLRRWLNLSDGVHAEMGAAAARCFAENYEITHAARRLTDALRDCGVSGE